jgi:tRNA threonylcarbamoyladenosine biosynthesis protein TsaB
VTVLGIETATAVCGASVVRNGKILSHHFLEAHHIHSEKLMTMIDRTLKESHLSVDDLDGIAISIGPGSFTGLRIGLSTAKGLSYSSGKPLVAVPTLFGLAYNAAIQHIATNGQTILPMIDARRTEVYCALYRNDEDTLNEIFSAQAQTVERIEELVRNDESILVVGDGAEKFRQFLMTTNEQYRQKFTFPQREKRICSAGAIALLGEEKLRAGEIADVASLEPLYVKDFSALIRTQHATMS